VMRMDLRVQFVRPELHPAQMKNACAPSRNPAPRTPRTRCRATRHPDAPPLRPGQHHRARPRTLTRERHRRGCPERGAAGRRHGETTPRRDSSRRRPAAGRRHGETAPTTAAVARPGENHAQVPEHRPGPVTHRGASPSDGTGAASNTPRRSPGRRTDPDGPSRVLPELRFHRRQSRSWPPTPLASVDAKPQVRFRSRGVKSSVADAQGRGNQGERIAQTAARHGVRVATLRLYEQQGILPPPHHTKGGTSTPIWNGSIRSCCCEPRGCRSRGW